MEPVSKEFPNSTDAIVWAIDDAWFSGKGMQSLGGAPSLDAQFDYALSTSETLGGLQATLNSKRILHRNVSYLKALVEYSISYGLGLGLGNFEYLKQNFDRLDDYRSAILLDVSYPVEGDDQYPPEGYGVYLLHGLLKSKRPKAEIFFVTAYPDKVSDIIKHKDRKSDPSWWPLFNCNALSKHDPDLKNSLRAFFENLAGRVDREDRFRDLARAFIDERRIGGDYTHPEDIKLLQTEHRHIPLLESFLQADGRLEDSGIESYTALYHDFGATRKNVNSGAYPISTQVVKDHCKYLEISVDVKEERDFRLPVQPGLVFLIYFCRFVTRLNQPQQRPILSFMSEPGGDWASFFVPLDDSTTFWASVLGSENFGRATTWFKRTLRGEGEFMFELAQYERTALPWTEPTPIKENKIYPLIVTPVISDRGVELKWKC